MELLIVIIAVIIVAVIALAFRTKPNTSGAVEQTPINTREYTSRRSVHPRRIRRVLTRIETQWTTD